MTNLQFSKSPFLQFHFPVFLLFAALNVQLTDADIDRALLIARERDAERAKFHARYIQPLATPTVQSVEIITEFRRVVLLAEDRILRGDRGFAYSPRLVAEALKPWKNRLSIVARLRFHPLNTYVNVPNVEITLDGPNVESAFIGILKEPQYGFTTAPDQQAPLVGATVEGVFDAALIGRSERTMSVRLDGKELVTTRLDFRAVE